MKSWLKILGVLLLVYVHTAGILFNVPRKVVLHETARGLYFHVPMWFGMVILFSISVYYAIRYLKEPLRDFDVKSLEYANVGMLFGIIGLATGMLWANYTWGSPWSSDPKQTYAAASMLVYVAYFILRGSFQNDEQKARLGAVYNIFAFAAMIPLIFILPRLKNSLHPGSDGNPGFNMYDSNSDMKMVFYPAVIGWCIIGLWITNLRIRFKTIKDKLIESYHAKAR